MKETVSQAKEIAKWLKEGKKLTALSALNKFGCFRLSARIHDLKDTGLNISKEMVKRNDKNVAEYSLTQ